MFSRTIQYVGTEWKLCGLFAVIIMVLSAIPLIWQTGGLINLFLFIYGLGVFGSFSSASSKIMRGETLDNKYLYILFNTDKVGYDFIILIVFFSAILLIFKGPFMLVQFTMAEKLNNFISSLGNSVVLLSIFFLLFYSIYKIALYSALANLFFYQKEVFESFKSGIKGIITFKSLLVLLVLIDLLYSLLGTIPVLPLNVFAKLTPYLIPAVIVLLMFSHFQQAEESLKVKEEMEINGQP